MNKLTPYIKGEMPHGMALFRDDVVIGSKRARAIIAVSDTDWENYKRLPRTGHESTYVLDLISGEVFDLAPAPCGLGCHCAAEIVWPYASEKAS